MSIPATTTGRTVSTDDAGSNPSPHASRLPSRALSAAKNAAYVGADCEIVAIQDDHSMRIHDGVTPGGIPIVGSGGGGGGGSGYGLAVWNETPSGTIDGSNATFTLTYAPSPSASLMLFLDGVLMRAPDDFTLSGNTITFDAGQIPHSGASLTASYSWPGTFSWFEIPSGTIDGSNDTFTLAHTPDPVASLMLYLNGILMRAGGDDYTLSGTTVVFASGQIPQSGDALVCIYSYV